MSAREKGKKIEQDWEDQEKLSWGHLSKGLREIKGFAMWKAR